MGCQCQKPDFFKSELTAEQKMEIKKIESDSNYLSNNNYTSIKASKNLDPNATPKDDFSKYIFSKINSLRENPKSFIPEIQKAKNNIQMDKSGIKIYKSSVKVALYNGESAFDEAIEILRTTKPMQKLIYNPEFVIDLPKNEKDIISFEYLGNIVKKKIDSGLDIKSFWKDIVKDKETCFILTVVDDNGKSAGNKRNDLLNRNNKYIGISSVKIGKSFACYIVIG